MDRKTKKKDEWLWYREDRVAELIAEAKADILRRFITEIPEGTKVTTQIDLRDMVANIIKP